ncbi:hypothetical protein [Streptomyces albus]|uniref:hypothetical protein n=1 Tax=Streptomyces albus TaxID=1888 RepID=UPI0024E0DDB9|nr:hypothetical protein [Streptomyces albus]GHJ24908.1 hypothetical protein TPA0909_65220 [Streptomyces albus]
MGVFARLLRRSSSKSTQDTSDATRAEETGTAQADSVARDGEGASGGAGSAEGRTPEAGATRESPPAAGTAAESAESRGAERAEGAAAEGAEGAPAARTEPAEGSVGIPKQQSAEEAADSETGDNARK